jgi:regulator of sigma E protease
MLTFILILSILVLIHEFGHFWAAKKNNVYVEEFGIGLPPRLFGLKKGETIYSINLLPFGGFVKLLGEGREELKRKKIPKKLKNRTFVAKKPWQKAVIIIAGVTANFILGWLIASYLFTQGVPVPVNKVIIEKVMTHSPAEGAGLRTNDVIKSVEVKASAGKPVIYPLKSTEDLISLTKKHLGQEIKLTIQRRNQEFTALVKPRKNPPAGEGPLGVVITSFEEKKYPWYQAPIFGLLESMKITIAIVRELVKTIFLFFTFQKTEVEVAGPIGIAKITANAVKFGQNAVLQVLGLLSLNLAVVNILPFPALDGGRLSLIIYEAVSKKKINPKTEKRLNLIGFTILLLLIILVSINDIIKLFK